MLNRQIDNVKTNFLPTKKGDNRETRAVIENNLLSVCMFWYWSSLGPGIFLQNLKTEITFEKSPRAEAKWNKWANCKSRWCYPKLGIISSD